MCAARSSPTPEIASTKNLELCTMHVGVLALLLAKHAIATVLTRPLLLPVPSAGLAQQTLEADALRVRQDSQLILLSPTSTRSKHVANKGQQELSVAE